ncbi:MAG: hypothetical protein NTV94_00660 [Planctomycetota bacterium]|nr:hypothetical protein [Planctomycetota bacterium]
MNMKSKTLSRGVLAGGGGLLLILTLALGGCNKPVYQFGDRVEATYAGRTLTARLPETVRVPQAMAVLDQVLRDRGYSVDETSVTEDSGRVVARSPRAVKYPRLVVEANQTATSCVITMRNEPFGDKDQVEQMMRVLIERLQF